MKNIYKILGLAFAMSLAVACKPEDLTKNLDLQVNVELMNQMKLVIVEDYLDPETEIIGLEVEFLGPNAALVFDATGEDEVTVGGGIFSFGVLNNTGNSNNPLFIPVKLTAPGYKTKLMNFRFDGPGLSSETVKMLNLSNLPNNVEKADFSVTLNNGQTSQEENVNFTGSAAGVPNVGVTIPSGTQFLDKNGNIISGSNLMIDILTYEQGSQEEVDLISGGIQQENMIAPDGNAYRGYFHPNGTVDIEMSLNGTKVKSFNKDLKLTLEFKNPVYGDTVPAQVGDSVQLYSQSGDEDFRFEQYATVTGSSQNPILEVDLKHLSTYAVALPTFFERDGDCVKRIDFTNFPFSSFQVVEIQNIPFPGANKVMVSHEKVELNEDKIYKYKLGEGAAQGTFSSFYYEYTDLYIFPPWTPKSQFLTAEPVAKIKTTNKCTPETIEYFGVQPVTRYYKSLLVCPTDTNLKMGRTFHIMYKEESESSYQPLTWVINGDAKTELLEQGKTYHFAYVFGGTVPYDTIKVDKVFYRETFLSEFACFQ